jgi:hypothetical protein
MNLTKTITKTPIDINLEKQGATYLDQNNKKQPKYDEEHLWVSKAHSGTTMALLSRSIHLQLCLHTII